MMKGKIFAVLLVVMMLVGGLVLASCSACPGSGSCPADGSNWCGTGVTDVDDAQTALGCAGSPAKAVLGTGGECDC
jgi:hypothetical protein